MSNSAKRFRIPFQAIAIALLFLFGVAPIVLAAIGVESSATFSIYNDGSDGLSEVRRELSSITDDFGNAKYNVTNIISNLNVLNRFNGSGVMVIVGPSANFDETEFISLLLFLLRGGSLIIADDFGTGNQVLEPLFNAFEAWDKSSSYLNENFNVTFPSMNDIISGTGGNETDTGGDDGNDNTNLPSDTSFVDASELQDDFAGNILDLVGSTLKRFGFNGSALMDLGENDDNPNRPTIIDIDESDGPYSFTQGVSRIQTEMPTIISFLVNDTSVHENGTLAWKPLTKLSLSLGQEAGSELDIMRFLDFLFPLYSSKLSWVETDLEAAAKGEAEPDVDEWGNDAFSLALNLPILPGGGKIVFLADPSMFINRWTQQPNQNDNLLMITNLINMVTNNQEGSNIPIIFDFGHTYQGLLSPSLYSTALLKLIANMSMFPLVAPFVPLTVYAFGKRLVPETRRLRPILLTKRRGERGTSEFDKKIQEIKQYGTYGEPINYLSKRLVRNIRSDVRFEGNLAEVKNPEIIADFFNDHFPGKYNRRELRNSLRSVFNIAENPQRPLPLPVAKQYLILLKDLIQILE